MIEGEDIVSNCTVITVGLPNIIPYMFYFWKKDLDSDYLGIKTSNNGEYYAKQNFQRFIYAVNQPYVRDGSQSAFTNTSVFDRPYFEALFGGAEFPNGEFMIDYEEEIIEFQKWYMEVMSAIRSTNMFTFPVSTISLLRKDGKFVDEEFARWAIAHNMKWSDSNLFVDTSVNSLSNCCFDGSQKVLTKYSNRVNYMTFRELYDAPYSQTKRNFTVYHNGSWVKGKAIRLPKRPMYKITTSNNKEIIVTDNHLNPTLRGDIPTTELSVEDYLLFNNHKLDSVKDVNSHLTYEQGYLVGMYLGNGTINGDDGEGCATRVSLSLNLEQFEKSCEIIRLAGAQFGEHDCFRSSKTYNNVYQVTIQSDIIISTFIKQFVSGKYCFGKRLNLDCLLQSYEFRSGILDGYYLTNGCDCNKVYVASSELAEDIEILLNSLGLQSVIDDTYDGDHRIYRIRWYESHGNTEVHDAYMDEGDKVYFKIKSIEKYASSDEYCYCFEMPEDEPYFTLPNGIITHNCRLKSNIEDLGYVKMPYYSFTA